ncbi:hypothetical protein ABTM86_20360, partial [Acinetobacter baumannii]
ARTGPEPAGRGGSGRGIRHLGPQETPGIAHAKPPCPVVQGPAPAQAPGKGFRCGRFPWRSDPPRGSLEEGW